MSCHFGGFNCDLCEYNDKRREGLSGHYVKIHQSKLHNTKDYSHFSKPVRAEMERLARAQNGLEADSRPLQNPGSSAVPMATGGEAVHTYDVPLPVKKAKIEEQSDNVMITSDVSTPPSTTTPNCGSDICQRPSFLDVLAFIEEEERKDPNKQVAYDTLTDSSINNITMEDLSPRMNPLTPTDRTMEDKTKGGIDIDPTSEDIIILPTPPELRELLTPPSTIDTPKEASNVEAVSLEVVNMSTIDATVNRIREYNLPLYIHLVAEFHAKSTMAETRVKENIDFKTIVEELRDIHL